MNQNTHKRVKISTEILKDYSSFNSWQTCAHIVIEWLFIISAALCLSLWWNPVLYIFCVLWIGIRQHALFVLMHDATHFKLLKNKYLNDLVSDVVLAWPLLFCTKSYRQSHFEHHKYTNTSKDPDFVAKSNSGWIFPLSRKKYFLVLLKEVLGINDFTKKVGNLKGEKIKFKNIKYIFSLRTLYYSLILSISIYFKFLSTLLLYWFIPLFTVTEILLQVRYLAEHFGVENNNIYNQTRTTIPSRIEKFFLSPYNVNYHLEHHLFPNVVCYKLADLHKHLLSHQVYKDNSCISNTYIDAYNQVFSDK
jgi:fatty acid desaturase